MGKKNTRDDVTIAKISAAPSPVAVRMRLAAGKHAIKAAEAEIHLDGARIAGGTECFEFDLAQEAWIELVILRV